MPQLREGNQTHPYDWAVVSCSRKLKYDINSLIGRPSTSLIDLVRKEERPEELCWGCELPEQQVFCLKRIPDEFKEEAGGVGVGAVD